MEMKWKNEKIYYIPQPSESTCWLEFFYFQGIGMHQFSDQISALRVHRQILLLLFSQFERIN